MFEWREAYSTGVQSIDNQHKQLLSIAGNTVQLLVTVKDQDVLEDLNKEVESLKDYTRYHFQYEEEIMARYHYPDLAKHLLEHREIIEKLEHFNVLAEEIDQELFLNDLIRFIGKWLLSHVMSSDMGYKIYFEDHHITVEA